MNGCLQRQREKSFHEPSALCSLKMCHIFWSFDKVCQYFIKLCFLYMVAKKLYYWHAIFTLKLVLQITAWKQTYIKRCIWVCERKPRFSVLPLTGSSSGLSLFAQNSTCHVLSSLRQVYVMSPVSYIQLIYWLFVTTAYVPSRAKRYTLVSGKDGQWFNIPAM